MFTTEGHIVSLDKRLRVSVGQNTSPEEQKKPGKIKSNELKANNSISNVSIGQYLTYFESRNLVQQLSDKLFNRPKCILSLPLIVPETV